MVVNITVAEQGTTITLADVAARAASSTGRLRFRVQAIGLALPPSSLTVNLTPDPGLNPITPASDGSVDVTVPEGLYAISVVAPGHRAAAGEAGAGPAPAPRRCPPLRRSPPSARRWSTPWCCRAAWPRSARPTSPPTPPSWPR